MHKIEQPLRVCPTIIFVIRNMKLSGSIVALITPFDKNNRLDLVGLRKNIEFQLKNKTNGFVPCGTTGESPTLTEQEWE